jgi:hypothetical protein
MTGSPSRWIKLLIAGVEMFEPARRTDLVLDQVVDRRGIRHPQQRLGEAHQRDALMRRERIFSEEPFEHPARTGVANPLHQPFGPLRDGGPRRLVHSCLVHEAGDVLGFAGRPCFPHFQPRVSESICVHVVPYTAYRGGPKANELTPRRDRGAPPHSAPPGRQSHSGRPLPAAIRRAFP